MLDFIRLTRPLNLLIMAATMLLMRYGLLEGQLERGLHELLQEPGIDVSLVSYSSIRASVLNSHCRCSSSSC